MSFATPQDRIAGTTREPSPASDLQLLVETLRKRIATGQLAPGAALQEHALADEFGVSRGRIREALLVLQQRGLVGREPNRTAVVIKLDLKRALEILDVREPLEGLCVRLATRNRRPEHWQSAVDLFHGPMERYASELDYEAYLDALEGFRATIMDAAENSVLRQTMDEIHDRSRAVIDRTTILPGRLDLGLRELQEMVNAMRRGDAVVAERLRIENVRSQREFLLRYHALIL